MEAKELRQLKKEEIQGKVLQWKEELFRNRFKAQTSEAKDTSIFPKLKRDIARGLTILHETSLGITREAKPAADKADKPAKAKKTATKSTKKTTSAKKD